MRRAEVVLALALTAVAVWLHVARASHAGALWRDEAGAAQVALLPSFKETRQLFQHEAFPLLFPLTVRAYATLAGASDQAFRLFGLLVGLGLLAAIWHFVHGLTRDVPLVSLSLIGISPLFLQWGDNLRGYGLATAIMLVASALLWKVATTPSPAVVTAALVAAIASVHLLYYNAVSLFAIAIAATVVAARNRRWSRALVILAIGAAAALSLMPYSAAIADVRRWSVIFTVPEFRFAMFAANIWEALGTAGSTSQYLWVVTVLAAIAVAIAAQTLPARDREQPRHDASLFCVVVLLVSIPAYFAFLRALRYPTQPWYYFALLALVAVVAEGTLLALRSNRWRSGTRITLALLIAIAGFAPARAAAHLRQTNMDLVARHLTENASSEDLVILAPWYLGVSFARYYKAHTRWITLPPIADSRIHRYDLLQQQMASPNPIEPVLRAVEATLSQGHRVWIVGTVVSLPPGKSPLELAPAPQTRYRWAAGAYAAAWNQQLGSFVQRRALSIDTLSIGDGLSISRYEKVPLTVLSGWRTAPE
ncbi:MAG TPA: hypothetical protein VF683_06370 [Chthoniobacterales bacterium]